MTARLDLLRGSAERVFALLAASRVDDEAWRAAVAGETTLWRALRQSGAPDLPPHFATVHRRSGVLLDRLMATGDELRAAVEWRTPDLLACFVACLDEAKRAVRAVFAAAFQVADI